MNTRWRLVQVWVAAVGLAGSGVFRPPAATAAPDGANAPRHVGESVDADAPAVYRLPQLSSFAPAPADAVGIESTPVLTVPAPPTANGLPPQSALADGPTAANAPASVDVPSAPTDVANDEATRADGPRIAQREAESPAATPPLAAEAMVPSDQIAPAPRATSAAVPPGPPQTAPVLPTGVPLRAGTTQLTAQLLPSVRRGYALAQRGAMYAARAEFVQVLRRIAQAKDAASNSDAHSRALAAGLRAIDEAEDFVPDGVRVEAELDVRLVASSHRTPVLDEGATGVSPHEAVALYHAYAQQQLAAAVGGEQAGSMVLHGLGKVSATLSQRSGGDPALVRSALTMYSAALAACPVNPLAANELGVLLVREGRADEAARLFERAIDLAPSATAYHNLAVAQAKLGFYGQAAANEAESQRLAAYERASGAVSRRAGVEWVAPAELAGVPQPALQPMAHVPPRPKSPWQKTVEIARSLPLPGVTRNR